MRENTLSLDAAETWHHAGIEFTAANYRRHRYCPHFHEQYSIGLIVDGALRFSRGRRDYIATAGDVTLINPGETHTGQAGAPSGWVTRNLLVPAELMRECDEGRAIAFTQSVVRDPALFRRLAAAHHASRSAIEFDRECARFDVLFALTPLLMRSDDVHGDAPPRNIARVREFVHDNYMYKITLDAMASAACLSKFHFVRTFTRQLGISPHAFVVQVRLRAALSALRAGRAPVDVATASGFADQAHFSRTFKRTLGVSPHAYMRAAREYGAPAHSIDKPPLQ